MGRSRGSQNPCPRTQAGDRQKPMQLWSFPSSVVCMSHEARTLPVGAEHTRGAPQHGHPGLWTHEAQVWPKQERSGLQVHDIRVPEKEGSIRSPLEFASNGRHQLIEAEQRTDSRNDSFSSAQAGRRDPGALRGQEQQDLQEHSIPPKPGRSSQ